MRLELAVPRAQLPRELRRFRHLWHVRRRGAGPVAQRRVLRAQLVDLNKHEE